MAIKKVEVKIKGKTALLMHRFPMEPIEAIEKKTKEEQAELAAYKNEDGLLYIPGICIQRCLVNGSTYSKGKGRASLQKQVAACVMVEPEQINLGIKDYKIDARAVVIPSTKGRIIRFRPRLDDWKCSFFVEFDDVLLKFGSLVSMLKNKRINQTMFLVELLESEHHRECFKTLAGIEETYVLFYNLIIRFPVLCKSKIIKTKIKEINDKRRRKRII